MENESKIVDIYKKKISLLKKHNKSYFQYDSPRITDAEYDKLKIEITKLEKKKYFSKKIKLK